jgi:hypothetical protein
MSEERSLSAEDLVPGENAGFVLDMNLRQIFAGDFVVMPCFNSIVDRGMVINVRGSTVEFVILSPETGIPETIVLDLRRPDPATGLFGRYGYVGVQVCARKGEPAARDFARQLVSACREMARQVPKFNPYMMAQANARVEFLSTLLDG